jgi:4-hydroxy-tetrahydrodipicolinate synthase
MMFPSPHRATARATPAKPTHQEITTLESPTGLLPTGLIAPNLTPFNADLSVDQGRYIAHARNLLDTCCVGLAPFGTTGEALSVGIEERIETLQAAVAGGIEASRLVPGTGLTNIADTLRLTTSCLDLGCAAVMVLPPFYYKGVPDDGLYAYFAKLIEAVGRDDLRIYLYHIPQVAGVGIPVSVVKRLRADFPRQIIGIKDSSGDWANTEALLGIDGLTVYPGSEAAVLKGMKAGAPGCISAMANTNGAAIAAVIEAFAAGRREEAERLHNQVAEYRLTVVDYAPINAQKRMLAIQSGDESWATVRPPLVAIPEAAGRDLLEKLAGLDAEAVPAS